MNHYLFEDLLTVKTESELRLKIQHITEKLGFELFCYGAVYQNVVNKEPPKYFELSNYPKDWLKHFSEENYICADPTVLHCYTNTIPLIWSHKLFSAPNHKELHQIACSYGINGGATLPIHSNWLPGVGCLNIATGDDADKVTPKVIESLANSQLLTGYINQAARELGLLSNEQKFVQTEELTPREKESLRWAIQGLQDKEIAQKMKISPHTISQQHLKGVRKKLNVSNMREAISLAVYHRIVPF